MIKKINNLLKELSPLLVFVSAIASGFSVYLNIHYRNQDINNINLQNYYNLQNLKAFYKNDFEQLLQITNNIKNIDDLKNNESKLLTILNSGGCANMFVDNLLTSCMKDINTLSKKIDHFKTSSTNEELIKRKQEVEIAIKDILNKYL